MDVLSIWYGFSSFICCWLCRTLLTQWNISGPSILKAEQVVTPYICLSANLFFSLILNVQAVHILHETSSFWTLVFHSYLLILLWQLTTPITKCNSKELLKRKKFKFTKTLDTFSSLRPKWVAKTEAVNNISVILLGDEKWGVKKKNNKEKRRRRHRQGDV